MSGGIPSGAVAASVVVLLYSVVCLTLSTLLVCLLISFGERWTYVTIFSGFTALSTLASIIQQLHYATSWVIIKEAQFDLAVKSLEHPGLSLGGAAQIVDQVLFYIQFYCYNVMSLNILFWTVALFTGAWGIRSPWLGDWYERVSPISKIFAALFPAVIVGLLNVESVTDHTVSFAIVAYISMFTSLTIGSILLILIMYKYMKTRRLVAGYGRRGAWWASGGSKDRRDQTQSSGRDIGNDGTLESGVSSSTRRSIYDRALVTRFSIGFVILALFEVAIIVFTLFQASNNATIAASGQPDFTVSSTNTDILLFIPGVTASLVAFLVFGTAKSWREYRDLVVGGCGFRQKIIVKRAQRAESAERNRDNGGLEFERLPSLKTTPSEEERKRGKEAENRVRMFSREIHNGGSDDSSRESYLEVPKSESAGRVLQFHRPLPRTMDTGDELVQEGSSVAGFSMAVSERDEVIQYGSERDGSRRFVMERLPPTSNGVL